jgi:hypothetical protein
MEAAKAMPKGPLFGMLCACATCPLIITATFMGLYWSLFSDAAAVNEEYNPSTMPDGYPGAFDNCGGSANEMSGSGLSQTIAEYGDTKWSVVFTLNAIVYTLLTVFTICIALSAVMWPLAICGACGVCCTQMAHFASLIVTGVFRYSSAGEKCAK